MNLVLSVQVGMWLATFHREDCRYAPGLTHTNQKIALPPSMRVRLCRTCQPALEDVISVSGTVSWAIRYADAMNRRTGLSLEQAEDIQSRRDLGVGKVGRKAKF